jgi:hypothetical protein
MVAGIIVLGITVITVTVITTLGTSLLMMFQESG